MTDEPRPIPLPPHAVKRSRLTRAIAVPGLAGIAVFLIAVVIAVVLVALRPHEAPAEQAGLGLADVGTDVGAASGTGAGPETPAPDDSQTGQVYAHVVGEVESEGVVELPAGARVADAIEAAGGATPRAALAGVNLARAVVDGEQIVVPDAKQLAATPPAVSEGAGTGAGAESGSANGASVNLNSADQAELETLPGVGPALAQRIIDWRTTNGGFTSVEQLLEVSGIGEKTLAGLRDRAAV